MKLTRHISIRHKQMILIMLTSTVALLLACAAFMAFDAVAFRRELVAKVSSLSEVVGNNTTAALDFNDPVAAAQNLAALRGEASIVQARVYRLGGAAFAAYTRPGAAPIVDGTYHPEAAVEFHGRHLHVFRPIIQSGEPIGTIEVVADLDELRDRLWRYAGIAGIVFVAALLVTVWLSAILGRVVSAPILHLSRVAEAVAQDKNYSVRATKQSDDELGRLIDGFNEMLGQIQARDQELQRARGELEQRVEQRTKELAGSLSLLNATLESTTDGIVAMDLGERLVSYNSKFLAIWGLSREQLEQWQAPEFQAHAVRLVRQPDRFREMIERSCAEPERETFDVVELTDGRVFERYAMPQRIDSKCVGVVVNWRDITARKAAEAELGRTHQQLLETSRRAGMAEVATSVLHNVGNVLNSVNTSAAVVADRLKSSGAEGVNRVASLLDANREHLAEFLAADGRAAHVIQYLQTLAQHLATEQAAVMEELRQLTQNIDHIKEIVVMQQNYARISGLTESVNVTDLVEDALRMNSVALQRHQVQLVREYASDLPPITVEKHKVLQILVNLIRNAKYACDDSNRDDKRVTIRVHRAAALVRIAVTDNGVGIPAENLTRIFSHGFTTRRNGHGFGLHSGALAAKEMGGDLTATSDGVGCGATFILDLPVTRDSA
jgi:PAS domain S-box-containing protein